MRSVSWLVWLCAGAGLLPVQAQDPEATPEHIARVAGEIKGDVRYTGVNFPAGARWLTWAVDVPPEAEALLVIVRAQADVDVYLRHGVPMRDYARDPDHRATGPSGEEVLLIDGASRPPLRPGRWFLDVAHPEGVEVPPFELMVATRNVPAVAWARRARQLRLAGDARGAARDCDRALQLDPREDEGWSERAQLRATLGDRAGAAVDLARALQLDPERMRGVADVAANGTYSLTLQPLTRQRGLFRIQVPEGCRRLHVGTSDAGADVDLYLREAVPPEEPRRDADHPRSSWRRDEQLWLEPGDVPRPLAPGTWWLVVECAPARSPGTLQVSIELDPSGDRARDPRWWFDRAQMHAQARQHEAALRALTLALQLDGQDPHLHYARAEALKELRRWREAVAAYKQVLTLAPDFPGGSGVLLGRATCLRELGDLDQALRDLDQLASALPRSAEVPYQRAQVLLRRHDRAGALAELDRALELEPGNWQALLLRAQQRAARGDRDGANQDHALAVRVATAQVFAAEGVELVVDEPRTLALSFPAGRKRRVYLLLLPTEVYTLTLDLRGAEALQLRARWGLPPDGEGADAVASGTGDKRVVLSRDSDPPLLPGLWYVELARDAAASALEPELSARWTVRAP